jgi:hypothetical protein
VRRLSSVIEDVRVAAEWISERLEALGYHADFQPESLREIDRFIDTTFKGALPRRKYGRLFAGLIDPTGRPFGFAIGAYVGEVLRRSLGGEWVADDTDPNGMVGIQVVLPTGVSTEPVMQFMRRVAHGPESSLARYGARLGLDLRAEAD